MAVCAVGLGEGEEGAALGGPDLLFGGEWGGAVLDFSGAWRGWGEER